MPPPACRTEPLLIITQCISAPQLLASTAAAARGPHLSAKVALRKEKAAQDLERPLYSQWAGGDIVVQEKRLNWGPDNPVPQGGTQFFLLNNWATTAGVRLPSVPQSQKASLPQVTEAAIKPGEGGLGSL